MELAHASSLARYRLVVGGERVVSAMENTSTLEQFTEERDPDRVWSWKHKGIAMA